MNTLYFLIPGDRTRKTGGYIYNENLIVGLKSRGCEVKVINPSITDISAAKNYIKELLPPKQNSSLIIDGLCFSFFPDVVKHCIAKYKVYYLLHLPSGEKRELNLMRKCKGIISTAPFTTNYLKVNKIYSVLECVPPPSFQIGSINYNTASFNLLTVGSVTSRKNIVTLISALSNVKNKWNLTICGETEVDLSYYREVINLIKKHQFENNIKFTGPIDRVELKEYYEKANLYISTSERETYGMALWDAVYSGIPVIISDIEPNRINFSGINVTFFNSEVELSSLLNQFFLPENYNEMVKKSIEIKESLKTNTWKSISGNLMKFVSDE